MSAEFIFDTAKPIFILEVINTISEAAKAQVDKLHKALKKRASAMQELMSTLSKLGKSGRLDRTSTKQSEAYEGAMSPAEVSAMVIQTQLRKNDPAGKGNGGSRNL